MYTRYTLSVRKIKNKKQFNELGKELIEKEIIHYALNDGSYYREDNEAIFLPFEETKWKNHIFDLMHIAEKFPNMYFKLDCINECNSVWSEYYHDMDVEYCKGEIVLEEPKKIQWTELIPF